MAKGNKIIILLMSGITLACALFIPALFFDLYDSSLLNRVYTEEFSGIPEIPVDMLNTKQRLKMICGYGNDRNIVLADNEKIENLDLESTIDDAITELTRMQNVGAFPKVDIKKENFALTNSASQVYTDLSLAGGSVKLYSLAFSFDQGMLQILKDEQTNQIYEYEIAFNSLPGDIHVPSLAKGLLDYTGIELANLSYQGDNPMKFATEDRSIRYNIYLSDYYLSVKLA